MATANHELVESIIKGKKNEIFAFLKSILHTREDHERAQILFSNLDWRLRDGQSTSGSDLVRLSMKEESNA